MRHEPVTRLHRNIEDSIQVLDGAGFWLARDLQELFGCTEWLVARSLGSEHGTGGA